MKSFQSTMYFPARDQKQTMKLIWTMIFTKTVSFLIQRTPYFFLHEWAG